MPDATPRRFALGVGFQTLGRTGHALAALGTLAVLTQTLDEAGVGVFASYLALYALLDVAVDAGSNMALLRRASSQPASLQPTLRQALGFRAVSCLLAALAALTYHGLDPGSGLSAPWGWLCVLTLLSHLPGTYGVLFHLRLRFGFPSLARSLASVASFGVVLLLATATASRDPMLYTFVGLAPRALGNVAIGWKARGLLRAFPRGADARPAAPGFVAESLHLGFGGVLRESYAQLDLLLLRWLVGADVAGLYAPARRTLSLALLLPNYLLTVATPPLAARSEADPAAYRRMTLRLAKGLALFALPAALLSLPLASWYLSFFGESYVATTPALRILAAAAAAAYPGMVFLTALIARGGAAPALLVSALALGLNTGINLALIPVYAVTGAAVARLAAEATVLIASAAAWRRPA